MQATSKRIPQGTCETAKCDVKIGLYLQDGGSALGGAEFWLACLAAAWSQRHHVTILHHKTALRRADLQTFSGQDLSAVGAYLPLSGDVLCWPWDRDEHEASRLSASFDLFLTITHFVPPACRAKLGCLVVLFPMIGRGDLWPWSAGQQRNAAWRVGQKLYFEARWRRRFNGYRVKASLSDFARQATSQRWGVASDVVHPPNAFITPAEKQPAIIVVGRFAGRGVSKRQLELVRLFARCISPVTSGWRLQCVGSVSDDPADQGYLAQVANAVHEGRPVRIDLLANASRAALCEAIASARIFWHGAGLEIDEDRTPELCEHFGIVAVEAMSAGCVPVVIGKGGLREIVEDGVSGFLCSDMDAMASRTRELIDNPQMLATMSAAARERAMCFSRERSIAALEQLIVQRSGVCIADSNMAQS